VEEFSTLDLPSRIERRRKALTVSELAELISLSPKQVYKLVQQGHLPSYRIAGSIRLDPITTAQWLRSQSA
jgi:excisionase family DNA binding protein